MKEKKQLMLIQSNPEYAIRVQERLVSDSHYDFEIKSTFSIAEGVGQLDKTAPDLILLELDLTDSFGTDTYIKVKEHAGQLPVVILATLDQEMAALDAIRAGASDYLLKGEVETSLLKRVVHNCLERQRQVAELQNMALTDHLTGLYNRRGFYLLGEQQVRLVQRNHRNMVLLMVDVDDFKTINDCHGHPMGDEALVQTAQILRQSFRESDIIARMGGDEFAVIAIEAGDQNIELLENRIHNQASALNERNIFPFRISLSSGSVCYDYEKNGLFEQWIHDADKALYNHKKSKKIQPF